MAAKQVNLQLDYAPRPWQEECHLALKRFSVLALHRRAGKTELALMQLIHKTLKFDRELGLFVYVAPYLKQARAIAWARLKQKLEPLRKLKAVEISESDMAATFKHNGAVIRLFGADNGDALRGMRLDGAVIDEVAQVKPDVWVDILQPALSDRQGWCLFIGTPSGVNLFSELFYAADGRPDWVARTYTCYDTDALDRDEIARMRRDMNETAFAREMLCDFSAAGDNQVISLGEATDASQRHLKRDEYDYAPRVIGVDVARFGDDRTVIFKRQGLYASDPIILRGLDNMQVAGRVGQVITDWGADACFIDAGGGSGVVDRLRSLGFVINEVNFGGLSPDPVYLNLRAFMWFEMRNWLRAGGVIPGDTTLLQELATPTYTYNAANKVVLESKDDIKKRLQGGASPDLADALAVTFAYPVAPKAVHGMPGAKPQFCLSEFDPFAA